ncbi:MAG: metallophosphoesterase [Candidatus Marsarchaeota archaeon]|nr:metallophosphoesterase [Candidatus Marsarchaeota archaeon]
MELIKDIELLEGLPIIYIKSLKAIVCSDLHLGYEGVMAKRGVYLPKSNLKRIMKMVEEALNKTKATTIIVDGDIKNEFSEVDQDEFNELYDFIQFLKGKHITTVLIKGNHDNFVDKYKAPFNLTIYEQEAKLGKYLFFHGEEQPKETSKAKMLIMGHEHPSIGVYNSVGTKEKIKCFLYGKYDGVPILVLPAMNYFASGTDINLQPESELLSPVFKHVDVDGMRAIAVGYGSTIDFGKISQLRKLAAQGTA